MRLPRDVSGVDLARRLTAYGYRTTRQTGSHIRLTTDIPSQHHVTVPAHGAVKIGTLSSILGAVAAHARIGLEEVKQTLFG